MEVPVRAVTIDISSRMLNRMLFAPDYEAPSSTPELEHRMLIASR